MLNFLCNMKIYGKFVIKFLIKFKSKYIRLIEKNCLFLFIISLKAAWENK